MANAINFDVAKKAEPFIEEIRTLFGPKLVQAAEGCAEVAKESGSSTFVGATDALSSSVEGISTVFLSLADSLEQYVAQARTARLLYQRPAPVS